MPKNKKKKRKERIKGKKERKKDKKNECDSAIRNQTRRVFPGTLTEKHTFIVVDGIYCVRSTVAVTTTTT